MHIIYTYFEVVPLLLRSDVNPVSGLGQHVLRLSNTHPKGNSQSRCCCQPWHLRVACQNIEPGFARTKKTRVKSLIDGFVNLKHSLFSSRARRVVRPQWCADKCEKKDAKYFATAASDGK